MEMPNNSTPPLLAALDAGQFRALALQRLLPQPPDLPAWRNGPSDFDLNPGTRPDTVAPLRPAAVLVPVVAGARPSVLLTQRTAHLAAHAGQIAFPGGKIEGDDPGPLAAALREAEEEIGLHRDFVEPLGFVEPYETGTGFIVTPVIAHVSQGFCLKPDPSEVASVFEVPLAFLLDEANHRIDTRPWRGAERRFYAIPHEDRYIWGATAGIIRALWRRLSAQ
jgi:8-oxo-dGTP pyrophosphatase MutT (NUDIX family)